MIERPRQVAITDQRNYPTRLAAISDPPAEIWLRGPGVNDQFLHLASIGSREVNPEQLKQLADFLTQLFQAYYDLAQVPLVIVSGLAKGVDGQSHQSAIDASWPTVGVLPTPIDRMYPPENLHLALAMILSQQPGNAVISLSGPVGNTNTPYDKNPLGRNRVTAGLSDAVLASGVNRIRSGTIHTIGRARAEHRPIFFLAGTVSLTVKNALLGPTYQATEVDDPHKFAEMLMKIKKG